MNMNMDKMPIYGNNLNSRPETAVAGTIFVDLSTKKSYEFDNGVWQDYPPAESSTALELTLSLPAASWSSQAQTVTNDELIADGYAYVVTASPDSFTEYTLSGVHALDVTTDGQMTFECNVAPTTDLTATVLRIATE